MKTADPGERAADRMAVPDNGGVRYRLLGPTRALRADGTPYPVGGSRLRALLTVLALRPGRTVPAATLVDQVWDGDTPADAAGALQALVSRLRRALGAGTVVSDTGGYRLCADQDDVDLYRFERLTAEGIRALDGGGPERAADLLDEALGLWHGPALSDLPDRRSEAARWEARRLGARRARLTASLALGHAEEALPELAALCDDHPIDELLQALRIRALRAVGRTAEALSAYEEVRRDLATRLGMDPGPELRALHKELLNPDAYANATGTLGRGRPARPHAPHSAAVPPPGTASRAGSAADHPPGESGSADATAGERSGRAAHGPAGSSGSADGSHPAGAAPGAVPGGDAAPAGPPGAADRAGLRGTALPRPVFPAPPVRRPSIRTARRTPRTAPASPAPPVRRRKRRPPGRTRRPLRTARGPAPYPLRTARRTTRPAPHSPATSVPGSTALSGGKPTWLICGRICGTRGW